MSRTVTVAVLLAALALGACRPLGSDGKAAREPADAPPPPAKKPLPPVPAAFQGDFDVRGTEPFWAALIRPGVITVMRPGAAPVLGPNNGPRMAGPQAVWAGKVGEEPLVVAMVEQDCSDGMSERVYPYAVEAQIGEASLVGCAQRPAG